MRWTPQSRKNLCNCQPWADRWYNDCMPEEHLRASNTLAMEAAKTFEHYSPPVKPWTAIQWLEKASAVENQLHEEGPHEEYSYVYWKIVVGMQKSAYDNLPRPTKESIAVCFEQFLERNFSGLRAPVWKDSAHLTKGVHILNLTATLETMTEKPQSCDALRRVLAKGWDPTPLLNLLYTTETKQRESLRLTENVTRRWTWPNHAYWMLLHQLGMHVGMGLHTSTLPAEHGERMWRVFPGHELKAPARAVSRLANNYPGSFAPAIEWLAQKSQDPRVTGLVLAALTKLNPALAPSDLAVQAMLAMENAEQKYNHPLLQEALVSIVPGFMDALSKTQELGLAPLDGENRFIYARMLWDQLVHGKGPDSVALPDEFSIEAGASLVK